jgi:DNA-binding GntR family transcriptional regulator
MRRKLSDEVRRQIEEEIASGGLSPGSHLDEQTIAERFNVSRTPAREALLQLSMAGLVHIVPRHGAVVSGHSAGDAVSLFEVLVVLEAEAGRLAARRMTLANRNELRRVHESGRTAVEELAQGRYAEANAAFHALIYEGASNAYLVQQIRQTRSRLRAYRQNGFETAARIRNSFAEHGAVVEAIALGDEAGAHSAMVQHIDVGGKVFADIVARIGRRNEIRLD